MLGMRKKGAFAIRKTCLFFPSHSFKARTAIRPQALTAQQRVAVDDAQLPFPLI
jgi:hypothetical protein